MNVLGNDGFGFGSVFLLVSGGLLPVVGGLHSQSIKRIKSI